MKFRITGKDLLIFLVFAILLLYLCAIAVANITSFSHDGTFSGLNPIPALVNNLGATLVLFFIFLITIFLSVSKSIFERKKGVGFEIGEKNEKGYSRWSKEKEIKNDKGIEVVNPLDQETKYAGIPLINDGRKLWVDNGEYHNLVIGATGSGKSQTIVEPMVELLIKKGESMIITDPKGELYKAASVYLKERGYKVVVLNFREPQKGNAWNPMTLPHQYYMAGNKDKSTELLDDVALNILYDPNNKGEPFWEKSAADYFSGLALGLFEDAKESEINLNSINYMSTVGEEKFAAGTYIKEYFTMKGEASSAYVFASNTINAPSDTKGGILSVFRQKIRLFASRENLSEMLAYSDFDMRTIGKEKTAVFIVIHDEKTTYHGLATIFIKQCYETLIDVAQQNGGKLPFRTNFILDEFANMPPLKDVTTMVTAARSRDIRFTFIIQNFAQLKSVYGNEDAETIKGNCGNLVYLISTELAALEEISKMCGEVKSDDKDKTASTPLVTVTDLQKLKLFEAIIIRWRLSPFKTKYTPNFQMNWGHPKEEGVFPTREVRPIELFDVKTFVKEKKRQNMMNSLDGDGGLDGGAAPGPFGGGNFGGGNPFGGGMSPFDGGSSGDGGLFGGFGGGGEIDLDAMMRDIDKKIAELDAEEERKKKELESKKQDEVKDDVKDEIKDEVKDDIKDAVISEPKSITDTTPSYIDPTDGVKIDMVNANDKLDFIKDSVDENTEKTAVNPVISTKDLYDFDDDDDDLPPVEEKKKVEPISLFDQPREENSSTSDLTNVAVATSSPIDEDEFDNVGRLPKVERPSMIQPNYNSSDRVVPVADNSHDLRDNVPNIMNDIKEDIKTSDEIKEETKEFVDSIPKTVVSRDKAEEIKQKLNSGINVYDTTANTIQAVNDTYVEPVREVVEPAIEQVRDVVPERANVNISADNVKVNDNVVSDDEFFDDFFGDE